MEKKVKVGVQRQPQHGYRWAVEFLATAEHEAFRFLGRAQYEHVVDQVRSLAHEPDPARPVTVDVRRVSDFYELREKGGPLGKINVRVFFIIETERRTIVLLGAIKKENEGSTPPATVRTMTRRARRYRAGEYGTAE